jgi:hypothetical protein
MNAAALPGASAPAQPLPGASDCALALARTSSENAGS